jgi:hypothetical protein
MAASLEALRLKKRINQINEQCKRDQPGDYIVHWNSPHSLSQAFAKAQKINRTALPTAR